MVFKKKKKKKRKGKKKKAILPVIPLSLFNCKILFYGVVDLALAGFTL